MNGKLHSMVALTALMMFTAAPAKADELTQQASRLLDAGKASEAYTLLSPQERDRSGQPEFDLLLGIAALEAGQPTRAVFALERVLAVEPGNARARAEIARAYLALGETERARAEFENVKRQGVPPSVAATIERFLAAVEQAEGETRPTLKGYVEAGFGIDDNVNSSMGSANLAIPGFGGAVINLGPGLTRTGDDFMTLGGGLRYRHPLGDGVSFIAGLAASQRRNRNDSNFDLGSFDGNAGFSWTRGADIYSLNLQRSLLELQSDRYREATGFSGQWQRNLSDKEQLTGYLQYSELKYPAARVRDADRWVAGGAYARGFDSGLVGFAGLYLGNEREQAAGFPAFGHDLWGARLGGEFPLSQGVALFGNFSYEDRRYGGPDLPLFPQTRKDGQINVQVGANFTPAKDWLLTPQFSFTKNDSNVQLNEYRRSVYSVTLRRGF
jgi:tetratricopeptide (TPR) repeat protein